MSATTCCTPYTQIALPRIASPLNAHATTGDFREIYKHLARQSKSLIFHLYYHDTDPAHTEPTKIPDCVRPLLTTRARCT